MRNGQFLAAALLAVLVFVAVQSDRPGKSEGTDSRVPNCTAQHHLYGIIEGVQGHTVVLKSTGSARTVYLLTSRATVRPRDMTIRKGLAARAYGCFEASKPDQNIFQTTYLTLATTLKDLTYISDRPEEVAPRAQGAVTAAPSSHGGGSAGTAVANNPPQDGECSGYRWPIKIGTDPQAAGIDLAPTLVAIAKLKAMKLSASATGGRIAPYETTVYELANVSFKRVYQEHDRDFHLIVEDATGQSVTLESPDPQCAGGSAFLNQIRSVRSFLDANKLAPGALLTVTGVGFYDSPGSGGMELHPLLSICSGNNCTPR